jgi:hypothetical protein
VDWEETLTLSEASTLGDSSTLQALDLSHTSGLNQFLSRTASKRRTASIFERLNQPLRLLLLPLLLR